MNEAKKPAAADIRCIRGSGAARASVARTGARPSRLVWISVFVVLSTLSITGVAGASASKVNPSLHRDFLLQAGLAYPSYQPLGSDYYLNVYYHLYARPAQSLVAPDTLVIAEMDAALTMFQQHGIHFVNQGYSIYEQDIGDFCDQTFELGSSDAPGTRIEIFVAQDAGGNACTMPSPLRLSAGSDLNALTPYQVSVLRHEMGHVLGLWHTFEPGHAPQDTVLVSAPWCEAEAWTETPYESDAALCGDLVADTPFLGGVQVGWGYAGIADPTLCDWYPTTNFGWDSYNSAGQTPQILLTNPRNLMNYVNHECQSEFSAGQVARMKVAIEGGKWPSSWDQGGLPWGTGGSVPSLNSYLFHGAIYPNESIVVPVEGEPMFAGETLSWTQDYDRLGQSPEETLIPTVQLTIRDALGQALPESGTYSNSLPFFAWIPSSADVGHQFSIEIEFVNQFSPYTHTATREFVVEDILQRQEVVTSPTSGLSFSYGAIWVTWTTTNSYRGEFQNSDLVLDVVDVLLSRDGGVSYPETLVSGAPNDGHWAWTPALGDYEFDARFKVVWHNIANSQTVEAESGNFSFFGGAAYSLVNRSSETGLSGELDPTTASAEPYGVATFSYDLPVPDLFVTHPTVGAQLYAAVNVDATGAPQLFSRVANAFVSNLPDLPVDRHRGLAAGNFDANGLWQNPGDAGEDLFLARESGARVYRNLGLNGQARPQFEDIADSHFGGATLFNGSWCGQWADINGDGLIDLVVGRATLPGGATGADPADPATIDPAVARVFLQRDESNPAAPGFDEATAALGITQTTAATSLLVEDLDGDGIVEIVLGDLRSASRGGASVVLHRTDVTQPFAAINAFPASPPPSSVSGMVAIDVDRDGELDLVVARQGSGSAEPAQVFRGLPGVSFEAPLDLDLGISQASVLAFDHDRNLTPDLVFSPEGSTDSPRFLANFSTNGNLHFVDRTGAVGLAAVGRARGAAAADFDADGRTDLYLGRPAAGQAFYFRSEKVTGSGSELPYIAVALDGGGGGNPADGSGSTVTILQNGSPLSSLSYGQPMGGSQSAQSLLFTVPDDGASYAVQVLWPEGEMQTESATLNQTQQIQDATNPQILAATMVASYSPAAGGTMSMSFQWDCTRQAVHDFDRVHLSAPCFGGTLVFGPSHPDVVMECVLNSDGTEHHKLTVYNLDCTPNCVVSWWCESSTNFVTSSTSASPKTIKTKVCVQ